MVIISIVATIICFIIFLSSDNIIYKQTTEYGRVNGVGSVFNDGNKVFYSTEDLLEGTSQIIIILFIIFMIIALVLSFTKKGKIASLVMCFLANLIPCIVTITASITNESDMKYTQSSIATYGEGVKAGIAGGGWFCIFLCVVAFGIAIYAFVKTIDKIQEVNPDEKKKLQNMSSDEFSM